MRLRSLQLRLAVRLGLVYVVAIAMAVSFFIYQAYNAAGSLSERQLGLRAADLVRYIFLDSSGTPRLDLPPELAAAYAAASDADIFAIRAADGRVVAASPVKFAEQVAEWPAVTENPSYFRLKNLGTSIRDYYGLSIDLNSPAGSPLRTQGAVPPRWRLSETTRPSFRTSCHRINASRAGTRSVPATSKATSSHEGPKVQLSR
jgi:hypothetical protein